MSFTVSQAWKDQGLSLDEIEETETYFWTAGGCLLSWRDTQCRTDLGSCLCVSEGYLCALEGYLCLFYT